MYIHNHSPSTPKEGFLQGDFRLFHIKDTIKRSYHPHYHDFLKIVVMLQGNVTYIIEGRSYPLRPGNLVLVDRGQLHCPRVDASLPYERLVLYLSPDFLEQYGDGASPLDHCFSTASYRHSNVLGLKDGARHPLIALLKRLERAGNRQEDFAGPLYCRLLCLEFLVELNRALGDANALYLASGALNYRVSGLISYINEHLSEDLGIQALSTLSCISPYHMMRIFKEETGYTVGNYIREKRLLKAKSLLSEGAGATEACYLCGFNNYSAFLRAYKKQFHELPRERMKS